MEPILLTLGPLSDISDAQFPFFGFCLSHQILQIFVLFILLYTFRGLDILRNPYMLIANFNSIPGLERLKSTLLILYLINFFPLRNINFGLLQLRNLAFAFIRRIDQILEEYVEGQQNVETEPNNERDHNELLKSFTIVKLFIRLGAADENHQNCFNQHDEQHEINRFEISTLLHHSESDN